MADIGRPDLPLDDQTDTNLAQENRSLERLVDGSTMAGSDKENEGFQWMVPRVAGMATLLRIFIRLLEWGRAS